MENERIVEGSGPCSFSSIQRRPDSGAMAESCLRVSRESRRQAVLDGGVPNVDGARRWRSGCGEHGAGLAQDDGRCRQEIGTPYWRSERT
jgi:hypothetical protein